MLTAALATATDAHQTAGTATVIVDGKVVKQTGDDHFVYRQVLESGCHRIVVKASGNRSETQYYSKGSKQLEVRVDHDGIQILVL